MGAAEENKTVQAAVAEQDVGDAAAQRDDAAEQAAAREAALRKRHRRRVRALRSFLIRLVLLAAVVYVLFFHIVGLTVMPSADMVPRMDAGDLLLFYRVNLTPKIQDVVVIRRGDTGKQYVCRFLKTRRQRAIPVSRKCWQKTMPHIQATLSPSMAM